MKRLSSVCSVTLLLAFLACNTRAWIVLPPTPIRTTSTLLHVAQETTLTATSPNETFTYHTVELYKPMGLILEQDESSNDDRGVYIASMAGAAARASQGGIIDLCIGDSVVKVGDRECTDWSLDQVMQEIVDINDSSPVDLTLRRPSNAVPVKFMDTGACIAAQPGMSIGALGFMAQSDIPYSCRNGGCGTCQHVMVMHGIDGKSKRQYVRLCVAKVPKRVRSISIFPCDEYNEED